MLTGGFLSTLCARGLGSPLGPRVLRLSRVRVVEGGISGASHLRIFCGRLREYRAGGFNKFIFRLLMGSRATTLRDFKVMAAFPLVFPTLQNLAFFPLLGCIGGFRAPQQLDFWGEPSILTGPSQR